MHYTIGGSILEEVWFEQNDLKEIKLSDYEIYSYFIQRSSYFTGLWASNFTYIWSVSRRKNVKIYWKITDDMLATFVLTKKGYLYMWCLPFGEGDANKVTHVLLKCLTLCREWNRHHSMREKPIVNLLNEPQLHFLSNSKLFRRTFRVKSYESKEMIWSIPKVILLKGKEFADIRNSINRIKNNHPYIQIREYEPSDYKRLLELKTHWNRTSGSKYNRITDDHIFKQVLHHYKSLHETILIATIGQRIVGFVSGAVLPNGIAWGCMAKALPEYRGIYEYLYTEFAKYLHEKNPEIILLHTGSDNNHEGLRRFKNKFRPIFTLNLYSIKPKR